MSQVETGQAVPPTNQSSAAFPPVYYDSPVTMMVLGVEVAANDLVTATITVGAPYFTVSQVSVSEPLNPPLHGPGGEGPPRPILSGGDQPAMVAPIGLLESAKLFVTVNVPPRRQRAVGSAYRYRRTGRKDSGGGRYGELPSGA